MKFKLVKPNCTDVGYFNYHAINTGDVIELDGWYAEKAKNMRDLKRVGNNSKITITPDEAERRFEELEAARRNKIKPPRRDNIIVHDDTELDTYFDED